MFLGGLGEKAITAVLTEVQKAKLANKYGPAISQKEFDELGILNASYQRDILKLYPIVTGPVLETYPQWMSATLYDPSINVYHKVWMPKNDAAVEVIFAYKQAIDVTAAEYGDFYITIAEYNKLSPKDKEHFTFAKISLGSIKALVFVPASEQGMAIIESIPGVQQRRQIIAKRAQKKFKTKMPPRPSRRSSRARRAGLQRRRAKVRTQIMSMLASKIRAGKLSAEERALLRKFNIVVPSGRFIVKSPGISRGTRRAFTAWLKKPKTVLPSKAKSPTTIPASVPELQVPSLPSKVPKETALPTSPVLTPKKEIKEPVKVKVKESVKTEIKEPIKANIFGFTSTSWFIMSVLGISLYFIFGKKKRR